MYVLKDKTLKITLKRQGNPGVTITADALEKNQNLAGLILNDPQYFAKYGHNINWQGANPPPKKPFKSGEMEIDVNVKKKQDSEGTASTSTDQPTDGKPSAESVKTPVLQFSDSQGSKVIQKRGGSQKRK